MSGDPFSFELREGLAGIDWGRVTQWLSACYWSPGIMRPEVEKGARHSALVIGAFAPEPLGQVGYMRVVSDCTRFAYLMDVVVAPEARRRGIARAMVSQALGHRGLSDVYQWLLRTRDAHSVYAAAGFAILDRPENWMTRLLPRPADRRDVGLLNPR